MNPPESEKGEALDESEHQDPAYQPTLPSTSVQAEDIVLSDSDNIHSESDDDINAKGKLT